MVSILYQFFLMFRFFNCITTYISSQLKKSWQPCVLIVTHYSYPRTKLNVIFAAIIIFSKVQSTNDLAFWNQLVKIQWKKVCDALIPFTSMYFIGRTINRLSRVHNWMVNLEPYLYLLSVLVNRVIYVK